MPQTMFVPTSPISFPRYFLPPNPFQVIKICGWQLAEEELKDLLLQVMNDKSEEVMGYLIQNMEMAIYTLTEDDHDSEKFVKSFGTKWVLIPSKI